MFRCLVDSVADSVNVYGLKYIVDNYKDSMRVLTGDILGK